MQRINYLILENFKFFYGKRTIPFDRKNILIYGENGSGKSSIYWALYTFLQSIFKEKNEVKKYFDQNNPQNLINRFADESAESAIIVELEDDNKGTTKRQISYNTINTKNGNLITEATYSSDFLNYRLLSRLYDFRNSQNIDLFPLLEREILMFVNFTNEFEPGNSNAKDWWESIKYGMNPRPKMNDPEYKEFTKKVEVFNSELQTYLYKIIESTNEFLQQRFLQPFKVETFYEPCTYDDFVPGTTKKRNKKTKPPKVNLRVEYLHGKLENIKRGVHKPHSFLNEAKLTCIALSIRFSVINEKLKTNAPKILVLDDLLLSLDMSNRDIVLEIILDEFKDFQFLFMTHDRMFFELTKHKIQKLNQKDNWNFFEIYEDEENGFPVPHLKNSQSYLLRAKKYFKEHEYDLAGNLLRKEAEKFCTSFLPKKFHFTKECNLRDLNGLITQLILYADQNGIDKTLFESLDSYRKFVLNPASHDSITVPKYKSEIKRCIETLQSISEIKYETIDMIDRILKFELSDGKDIYLFRIKLMEDLRLIMIPGTNSILSKGNVEYQISKNGVLMEDPETKKKIREGFESISKMYEKNYKKSDKKKDPDFWEEVIFEDTAQKLSSIRQF